MDERIIDLIFLLKQKCLMEEEIIRGEVELHSSEMYCIECFSHDERVRCKALSKKMNVSPSRASRVIEGLVEKGYLARREDSTDRRCREITLTQRGLDIKKKIRNAKNRCEERIRAAIDCLQLERVREGLRILIDNL